MRRFLLWYALLSKRLFRRPAYLAVLLLIPLFALGMMLLSRQESGALTAAVVCADPSDETSSAVAQRLLKGNSVLRCVLFDTEEEARDAVIHGRADAAWILSADMGEALTRFARSGSARAVTVIEREDNVVLMLSREMLFSALYPELSFSVFSRFVTDAAGEEVPRSVLWDYYNSGTQLEQVLRFATVDDQTVEEAGSYLVTPLRGILSLLLVLSGFASAMYCYREEQAECFVWLPARGRRLLPLLCHLTAILPAAAVVYVTLALCGMLTAPLRELLLLLLLVADAALFCELLRRLAGSAPRLGALIPLLMVVMVVFCPIFFDLEFLPLLRHLLPPFYYLRGVYNTAYLLRFGIYTAVLAALTLAVGRLRQFRL